MNFSASMKAENFLEADTVMGGLTGASIMSSSRLQDLHIIRFCSLSCCWQARSADRKLDVHPIAAILPSVSKLEDVAAL